MAARKTEGENPVIKAYTQINAINIIAFGSRSFGYPFIQESNPENTRKTIPTCKPETDNTCTVHVLEKVLITYFSIPLLYPKINADATDKARGSWLYFSNL